VTAADGGGQALATTVTDANGNFSFERLPTGLVVLTFHLDGFLDATLKTTVAPGVAPGPSLVQKLDLASVSETVVVRGDPPPPPPPPPPPSIIPVPEHDAAAVCAPGKAEGPVPAFGVVRASRKDPRQGLFAAGDEVIVEIGTLNGLQVGQNFVVRRRYPTPLMDGPKMPVMGEHSAGLIQIVSVTDQLASAVVVYACDAMTTGDYLAAFNPEPKPIVEPSGKPVFEKAAPILFAGSGETLGITNRMLVIGHGNQHGVRPGQRVTLFRRAVYGQTILGSAVVVAVRRGSATIHVEQASDVIFLGRNGDWAAIEQPSQVGRR
jgi:hypothetical protein